jgi:hypothetical protein
MKWWPVYALLMLTLDKNGFVKLYSRRFSLNQNEILLFRLGPTLGRQFFSLASGANVIKLFMDVIYEFLLWARAFVSGKPFQPWLMFAGKAWAYPSEARFRCPTLWQTPGLTHKHQTSLKRLANNKHSRFFKKLINYGHKKVYDIGNRWQYYSAIFSSSLTVGPK